jgi:hypothetical protein
VQTSEEEEVVDVVPRQGGEEEGEEEIEAFDNNAYTPKHSRQ